MAMFITGCSTTFVYNNIDWWIDWYVDDYVELSKQQQKAFDASLAKLHKWHRKTQLKRYVEQLNLLKKQVNRGITIQEIASHQEQVRSHWKTFINKAAPELAKLSKMLTKEQISELKANIENDNQNKWDDFEDLPNDKWIKERQTEQIKELKEWIGSLTNAQKLKVNELASGYQRTFTHWMEYRSYWQSVFFELIEQEQLNKEFVVAMTDLLVNGRDKYRSDEYKQIANVNNKIGRSIMFYQLTNLTAKQQKKFNREIDSLIEDLSDLIED